jgi:hypothetical protein
LFGVIVNHPISCAVVLLVVAALIAAVLPSSFPPGAQELSSAANTTAAAGAAPPPSFRTLTCEIQPFADSPDPALAVAPPQEAMARCLQDIGQLRGAIVLAALSVGHADKRELKPTLRAVYTDNFGLAYRRAREVETRLRILPALAAGPLIAALPAGADEVGRRVASTALERDRRVTVSVLWQDAQATSGGQPASTPVEKPGLDVLALLGIAIALSAYLASVRQSLEARIDDIKGVPNRDPSKAEEAIRNRHRWQRAIMVPDALLVVSAALLGVHVIWFPATGWLYRIGATTFTLAGLVLILFHGFEWKRLTSKIV